MIYKINNTVLPIPAGWQESYGTIEQVNESEAGTDLCHLIRANKLTLSITSNLTTEQKDALLAYSALGTVTVTIGSASKVMRLREVEASRVRWSERNTTELWECSYKLLEV